ncbi:MAG: hypothetical protein IPO67_02610 [Deltaproteobacteria bacterium]|nr:hypothetical protein [Deltaproteobacteria bacterium]
MQNKVRTAIIGLPQDHARQLHAFLRRVVDVALVREDPRDAMSPLLVARPQAVLLYLAEADGVGIQFARRMRSELPDTALVLLCHVEDVTLTREAMRLGARALIVVGKDDDDLARTFVKIAEEQRSDMPGGEVVTVLGSKGGVGATSLAINLAGALAIDPNLRVALIDLSPYLGEIGVYLQLDTTVSPRTLVRESLMIDDEWMQNAVPRHSLGFSVFAQPLKPGAPPLNVADIAQSIGILRRLFSHVVIDAGTGGSELGFAALAVASKPLLVMGGDTPSSRPSAPAHAGRPSGKIHAPHLDRAQRRGPRARRRRPHTLHLGRRPYPHLPPRPQSRRCVVTHRASGRGVGAGVRAHPSVLARGDGHV